MIVTRCKERSFVYVKFSTYKRSIPCHTNIRTQEAFTKSFDRRTEDQSEIINFDSKNKSGKEYFTMSNNKNLVPEAKEALNRFKMEAAAEVGVNLKQGYNGNLTSKEAGSVGGQMVKKMVESYENSVKNNG